ATGGTTHISSGTVALSETITAVNDAPAGTNNTTIPLFKNGDPVFVAADFGFTDPNDSPANNLFAGKITTPPKGGALKDNGVAVTAGQLVSIADINAGLLVFSAKNGDSGISNYAPFTFQVEDDGGTANGGVNLDQSPNTISFTLSSSTHPAGTAGAPINLGLADPSGHVGAITATIAGVPSGWTLSEGSDNGDGSWTVVTNDVSSLSITSPTNYTGALVLNVVETWTNADGSTGHAIVADNVEAY